MDKANDTLLQKILDLSILFVVPLTVGTYLIASRFVPFFFGSEFVGSIILLQILSFKIMFLMLKTFLEVNVLIAFGHEKQYLLTTVCAIFFLVILNLPLASNYGAVGVALSSVIIDIFSFGLLLYFANKLTKIRIKWSAMKNAIFFTLPFFVLYYFCNKFISSDVVFLCVFVCFSTVVYFSLQWLAKNYLVNQMIKIGISKLNLTSNDKIQ